MAVAQDPSALLERIRQLEDAGDVKEATALARAAVADGTGGYDWSAEVMRLDAEGKLARPYREGLEALAEGDYADAQRLLGWVAGKNPKYREVARHLYWAVEGRDPGAGASPEDEDPAPPMRARTALMSPLSLLFAVALVGLGLLVGYVFALSKTPTPPPVVAATPPQAAPAPVTTAIPASPPVEVEAPSPPVAPIEAVAPVEAAPSSEPAKARTPSASTASATSRAPPPSAADRANAAALGCQDGEARACFDLGDAYYYGRGTSKSMSQAMSAYARSCDHGHARGCFNAGDMVENAEAGPADPKRALELYARGCTLGDSDSCTRKVLLEVTSK